MPSEVRWLPLESNPEVINKYIENLGVLTDKYEFVDIYGLDNELLQLVPKPVIAVLLLFPVHKNYIEYIGKIKEDILKNNRVNNISGNLFFTKQTVQNACGTIAIIHALANNKELLTIEENKPFSNYLKATENLTPDERGVYLETDQKFTSVHTESAQEGQTEAPNLDDDVDLHFIAFVEKDGDLYELDGAKPFPLNHGPIDENMLLENTCEVVKQRMSLTPDELRYTLIGLVGKDN